MDKALKQRMVGASVLIALAVIVLPMLLGGRPEGDTQQTRKIELPAQPPELSFETRRYPIGVLDPKQAAKKDPNAGDEPIRQLPVPKASVSTGDQPGDIDSAAGTAPGRSGIDQAAALSVATKPAPAPLETSHDSGRYIVQAGSFSSAANAEKLVASLKLDGLSAYLETVSSSGSKIYRVRIGPFAQREEAMQVQREVQEKRSLDGVVMSAD